MREEKRTWNLICSKEEEIATSLGVDLKKKKNTHTNREIKKNVREEKRTWNLITMFISVSNCKKH